MEVPDKEMVGNLPSSSSTESITLGESVIHLKKSKLGTPYLLVKQPGKEGKERKCCWFPEDWNAVKEVMDKGRPRNIISVSPRRNMKVNIGDQSTYMAVETLDENFIVLQWMYVTLSAAEWKKLIEVRPKLDMMLEMPFLEEPVSKRMRLRIDPPSTLTQYKWQYEWTEGVVQEGYTWYFYQEDCRQNAEKEVFQDDKLTYLTRQVPTPTSDQMAMWMYRYLLRLEVVKYMKENCEACRIDHPSQVKHMKEGCLSIWWDGLHLVDEVCTRLDDDMVHRHCQSVWKSLTGVSMKRHDVQIANELRGNLYVPSELLPVFDKCVKT